MKRILAILFIFNSYPAFAQIESGKDSTAFLDSIFNEMDDILDQMAGSKSILSISISGGTGLFNFKNSTNTASGSEKKLMISPAVCYLHKSGFSISATGYAISDSSGMNAYQASFTPSYDFIKRGRWSTGIAYTRYFTKKELSFYTTPLQNEIYAYFNYKKTWLQPGLAIGYGWGNRTEFENRKIDLLRARRAVNRRLVTIRSDESISDFSVLLSARHDFDWKQLFGEADLFTLTPVLLLSSGTSNFGFNTSYQGRSKVSNNSLPANQYIKDKSGFEPQSASFILRADYSFGIFYFQSQMLFDYYLHLADKRLNNAFAVTGGVNF